jgi:LPS-assembly protein
VDECLDILRAIERRIKDVLAGGLLLAVLLSPALLAAQADKALLEPPVFTLPTGPGVITVTAEEQEKVGPNFHARGNVVVRYQDVVLKSDEMWGNQETRDVEGKGNVYFEQGTQQVWGVSFKYNLVTKTGLFIDAHGRVNPGLLFKAEKVDKFAPDKYRIFSGTVTACEDKTPKWSFRVRNAVLDVDHHVTAKNTTFWVRRLPVFFFPFMVVPARDTGRQTGFLIPSTGNSSIRGRSFHESFFLTLGRSADLLTTGEYFSKRGIAAGWEFRARFSENSHIYAQGLIAREYLLPPDQQTNGESARIIADHRFGEGFRAVADIDLISSQEFRQLYGDSFATIVRPDKISLAYLSKDYRDFSLSFLGERRLNRFSGFDEIPTNNVLIRTMPAVELLVPSRPLRKWPLFFSFDVQTAGLARSTELEDGQPLPGSVKTSPFVERIDFFPRLLIPTLRLPYTTWTNSVSLRETYYSERYDAASTTLTQPQGVSRTAFSWESEWRGPEVEKTFQAGDLRIKHVAGPEVTYRYITGSHNFDEILRFDERDPLGDTNEVEYRFSNRFYSRKSSPDKGESAREFLDIDIAQKYFFDPTFGGALVPGTRNSFFPLYSISAFAYADGLRRFSPLVARIRFTPRAHYTADFRMDYDPVINQIRATSVAGSVRFKENFLMTTYYNTSNLPPTQVGSNQIRATVGHGSSTRKGFNVAYSLVFDFRQSVTQYSTTQVTYNWDCCGISLEQRRYNVGIRVESQTRFGFWLKNVGALGNLRKQERIF